MQSPDTLAGPVIGDIDLTCAIQRSPRVLQMELGAREAPSGRAPPSQRATRQWQVVLPLQERSWHVGLIVGPSGAGKSSVARTLFGAHLAPEYAWSHDQSLLEDFPASMSIKTIVGLLNSVGFSSPPAWMRPFHTLSTGEQFRVTMARTLAERPGLVVVDEFTSVIDRQVAQVASHVLQKAVRKAKRQFVAVSCHSDIVEWLQPDWIYQPEVNRFQWRDLQRHPDIVLDIAPVHRAAWRVFAPHHYLSAALNGAAHCFGAFVGPQCIAFTSYRHFPHPQTRNIMQGHRLVVLPDWQGLGIGGQLDCWLGQYLYERGYRYHNTVAHPAMIASYQHSPRWQLLAVGRAHTAGRRLLEASKLNAMRRHTQRFSSMRMSHTFAYRPAAASEAL